MIALGLALLGCAPAEHEDPPEPGYVYVYGGDDLAAASRGSRVTAAALQGLLNRHGPRMFLDVNHGEAHDEDWLAALVTGAAGRHRAQGDLLWYLWAWADDLEGYVLFDSQDPATANAARVVGAARNAVPVDIRNARIHSYVAEDLALDKIADVRTWSDEDSRASGHVDRLDLSGLALMEPFSGTERLPGDQATAAGHPVTWVDPREDPLLTDLHAWLGLLEPGARLFGDGYTDARYGRDTWVQAASAAGVEVVPTGSANNLSLYAALDSEPAEPPALPALPGPAAAHRVALVVGGGESVGDVLGRLTHPARGLWAHPERGSLPLGWALSPHLADLAPPVLHHLYAEATPEDAVVAGVLVDPDLHPDLAGWSAGLAAGLDGLGAGVVALPAASPESLEVILAPAEVRGALLLEGEGTWAAGKPAIAVDLLGFEADPTEEIDALAGALAARPAGGGSLDGYSVVYACSDTTDLDDLVALAEALGDQAELVRADVLVELILRDASP